MWPGPGRAGGGADGAGVVPVCGGDVSQLHGDRGRTSGNHPQSHIHARALQWGSLKPFERHRSEATERRTARPSPHPHPLQVQRGPHRGSGWGLGREGPQAPPGIWGDAHCGRAGCQAPPRSRGGEQEARPLPKDRAVLCSESSPGVRGSRWLWKPVPGQPTGRGVHPT